MRQLNFVFMEITTRLILGNIVKIRKNKGFSQDYVALSIGMKQAGYSLLESGQRSLDCDTLLQIANVLGVSVIDIITHPTKWVPSSEMVDSERISVTFEISPDKRDLLLKLVTNKE